MPGITLPEIEFPATGSGPIDIHDKETVWWIDPLFGARIKADLTDRIYLHLNGNVGGFDWGSASKLSWEALSTVGMRFKEHWAVEAGYKGIGEERDKGDLQVDLIFHGPIMGVSYRF
jgi:opacity protein-like surface antigen